MKRTALALALLAILALFTPAGAAQAAKDCNPKPAAATNIVVRQLECYGFVRIDASSIYSTDAKRDLHTEVWQGVVLDGKVSTVVVSDVGREVWDYRIEVLRNNVNGVTVRCMPSNDVYVLRALIYMKGSLLDPTGWPSLGTDWMGNTHIRQTFPEEGSCWYSR